MAQFTCSICGDGFEQKSRLLKLTESSHPPQAHSAAEIEKVLGGIEYPKRKTIWYNIHLEKCQLLVKTFLI